LSKRSLIENLKNPAIYWYFFLIFIIIKFFYYFITNINFLQKFIGWEFSCMWCCLWWFGLCILILSMIKNQFLIEFLYCFMWLHLWCYFFNYHLLSVNCIGFKFLISFMSIAVIPAFIMERLVFERETQNGWYSQLAFTISNCNFIFLLK